MDKTKIAQKHQNPKENLLMEIGSLASSTENLLDLSLGDPDVITDSQIINAAFEDVKNGHTKYTASGGSQDFLEAVQNFYRSHYQLNFDIKQIRATVGALHGMYLALQTIIDPGDEVIIHEPYFTPYKDQVEFAGGKPVFIPTYEKDGFSIDVSILEQAITSKTKAVIINSPNNPTGAVFPKETFQNIAELAKKHNFFILSDEIYEIFCYQEDFVPMATFAPEHTITFSGFSKAFAMTGWRIGYMIAPEYVNQAAKLINESITYSAPTPAQRAGIYALNHAEELLPQIKETFKKRLEYIEQRVSEIQFLDVLPIRGAIYAFVNIEKTGMDSVSFSKMLVNETQILVLPGKAFGENGDHYIRLAATQNVELLKEAFDRIAQLKL